MLPDLWLANTVIRRLWKTKFPAQPKVSFINLVQNLFGTIDLTRNQVSIVINMLTDATTWPVGKLKGIDPNAPDSIYGAELERLADLAEPTPDWVFALIGMLLPIPTDVSVLDLCCGIGTLASILPTTAFYEGHDSNPVQVARASRNFPGFIESCSR